MSTNYGPVTRGASSLKKWSPIPHALPNINLETEEGESGEEELTWSYQDANTARTDITRPAREPSILDTLWSSLPMHVSSSTNNQEDPIEVLVVVTPPIEIPEPTPKDLLPSRPVHKAMPTPHNLNKEPTDPVAKLIGKFVRSAIARVAEAREVPIPSEDLAHFI